MNDRKSSASFDRALLRLQVEADAWADAASASLGVNRTDFACLRALLLEGACTAGRLAEVTGLTTGAVTGVVDRLEKASFVRRGPDPDDRRKVILELAGDRADAFRLVVASASAELPSNAVAIHLERSASRLRDETIRLRGQTADSVVPLSAAEGSISVPLRHQRQGRLEIAGGALDLAVLAEPIPGDLLRAEFSGPPVRLTEQDGHVRIAHRTLSLRRPEGTVHLTSQLPWSVRVGGGRNKLSFDLRACAVHEVEIDGGDGDLRFEFGQVDGVLPFRVNGGASTFVVSRPAGVDVEVVAKGRISKLTADGVDRGALTAKTWSSGEGGRGHIRIHVRGGLNKVAVETAAD